MNTKEYLIEKLTPAIKEIVPEENWNDIPSFFSRVYAVEYEDGVNAYVVGYWDEPNPLLALHADEYTFIGIVMQEWVEGHGIRIIGEDTG